MDAIGGYFGLELRRGKEYHENAIKLNSARNCFEYILRARKYQKVHIPYYTCEVILEPLEKTNVQYEFYPINENLEPVKEYSLKSGEVFLYTNYFGLKQQYVEYLAGVYGSQLIVDNAQAFYAPRIEGIDTFYSPRKFFGVADGGYLYTANLLDEDFEQDYSFDRMSHLLKRIDVSAEAGYSDFRENDDSLINQSIKKMSKLTDSILSFVEYEKARENRRHNFVTLHNNLKEYNELNIQLDSNDVPMVYPFLIKNKHLKPKLTANRIYIATYWVNVLAWRDDDSFEYQLATDLLPLPIDQRYTNKEMEVIIKLITENL